MTSYSPRIYLYKITFEEVPYYYYGVHKEKVFGEEYWGSPYTHKWCWELYTPKKQILQFFDFTDEGWLEVQEVETRLIRPFYQTDKWCLNENVGGKISLKVLRENGRKVGTNYGSEGGKIGGSISGLKTYQLGIGVHGRSKEQMTIDAKKGAKNGGKKAAEINKINGGGFWGIPIEERRKNSRKAGLKCKELGLGVCGLSKEQRSEIGKKSAETNRKNKTGLYGIPIENRKETAKKVNTQRWECTETGYISTPAGLSAYQRPRGIDTSKRVRIS
jgi:hypothetical protein